MKAYIKPVTTLVTVELATIIATSPVTKVTGADGLEMGEGEFGGGEVDSRRTRNIWDDDDEDF